MARARVVLLVGEPGSGKSTLGRRLAEVMRLPFLARDDVRRGMFVTNGQPPSDDAAVDAFVSVMEAITARGVSCIAEYVVRASRPDVLDRLTAAADCVVVRTWCTDAAARRAARDRADRALHQPDVLAALGFADADAALAASESRMRRITAEMRTDFDVPVLLVGTDDGYVPPLAEIVDFATGR